MRMIKAIRELVSSKIEYGHSNLSCKAKIVNSNKGLMSKEDSINWSVLKKINISTYKSNAAVLKWSSRCWISKKIMKSTD